LSSFITTISRAQSCDCLSNLKVVKYVIKTDLHLKNFKLAGKSKLMKYFIRNLIQKEKESLILQKSLS